MCALAMPMWPFALNVRWIVSGSERVLSTCCSLWLLVRSQYSSDTSRGSEVLSGQPLWPPNGVCHLNIGIPAGPKWQPTCWPGMLGCGLFPILLHFITSGNWVLSYTIDSSFICGAHGLHGQYGHSLHDSSMFSFSSCEPWEAHILALEHFFYGGLLFFGHFSDPSMLEDVEVWQFFSQIWRL